jgi:hypothetical protein
MVEEQSSMKEEEIEGIKASRLSRWLFDMGQAIQEDADDCVYLRLRTGSK